MTELRKLKDKASEAFAKGRFAKAAELYSDYCEKEKKDTQARLRMGDAFAKAGNKAKAISAYQGAAEGYARDGFLPRAIAASKLILELDPSHTGVQQMLADLYAKKTGGSPSKAKPMETPRNESLSTKPVERPRNEPAPNAPSDLFGPAGTALGGEGQLPPELELETVVTQAPSAPDHEETLVVEVPTAENELPASEEVELIQSEETIVSAEILLEPGTRTDPSREETDTFVLEPDPEAADELIVESRPLEVNEPKRPTDFPIGEPKLAEAAEPEEVDDELLIESRPLEHPEAESADTLAVEGMVPPRTGVAQPIGAAEAAARAEELAEKLEPGEEVFLLDRPKTPPPPSAQPPASSRIWLPQTFTPLPPPAPLFRTPLPPRLPPAQPNAAGDTRAASDLRASLAALSSFDELDLESAGAAATANIRPAGVLPSFTELELEGDSLLHAVELAAQAARATTNVTSASQPDDAFSIGNELVDDGPGEGALPKIPLFSDLSPEAFIALFERCPLRRFSANERVLEEGSLGDSFFVICAGSVKVFRYQDGERKEIAKLEEGAFFGEMALLSGAPRAASVEAGEDETQLLEISAQVLAQLSQQHPAVAEALKKFCRQRMLANVMGSSALFRPFDKKERRALVERFRARDVPKGTTVVRQGDVSDGLYVVLSGELEVRAGEQVLARLKEADLFGEMSLLTKAPATATVRATKRASLLRLPRADFDQLISSHPQILVLVSELTDDRKRQNEAVLSGAAAIGEEGLLLV